MVAPIKFTRKHVIFMLVVLNDLQRKTSLKLPKMYNYVMFGAPLHIYTLPSYIQRNV